MGLWGGCWIFILAMLNQNRDIPSNTATNTANQLHIETWADFIGTVGEWD